MTLAFENFLHFGAFAPRFDEQPVMARFTPEERKRFQELADAITNLRFGGVLTASQTDRARSRLAKLIWQALKRKPAATPAEVAA